MAQFFDPDDPLGLKKMLANGGATGGVATLAPTPAYAPTTPAYAPTGYGGYGAPVTSRPTYNDPAYNAQTQQFDAQQRAIDARYGVVGATQAQQPYQMATLMANRGVLGARQAAMPAEQGLLTANRGVLGAQGVQTQGESDYIARQQAENATLQGENTNLVNATNNTADQAAVAQFRRTQAVSDARNRALGIAPTQEITAPVGFSGALPPGVRAKATTQAEDVARTNTQSDTARGFDLNAAKLAVSMMGNDVAQATLVARNAGLTLDQAQLAVKNADLAATSAGLDEKQAGFSLDNAKLNSERAATGTLQADLNLREADRPPFPGAERYTDPNTGQRSWMTPSEADNLNFQHQNDLANQRYPTQFATQQNEAQYRTQQESGGTALGALNEAQLLNMLPNNASIWEQRPVLLELIRRYKRAGATDEQAATAAQNRILEELDPYKRYRVGGAGGSGPIYGAPPSGGGAGAPATPATPGYKLPTP